MKKIELSDDYLIGVGLIDEQHQKLINFVNELIVFVEGDELSKNEYEDFMDKAIHVAKTYVLEHFKYEEELMEKYNFPLYKQHKSEHRDFTKKIIDFAQTFQTMNNIDVREFIVFFIKWVHQHIFVTDQKYKLFFRSKGVR